MHLVTVTVDGVASVEISLLPRSEVKLSRREPLYNGLCCKFGAPNTKLSLTFYYVLGAIILSIIVLICAVVIICFFKLLVQIVNNHKGSMREQIP